MAAGPHPQRRAWSRFKACVLNWTTSPQVIFREELENLEKAGKNGRTLYSSLFFSRHYFITSFPTLTFHFVGEVTAGERKKQENMLRKEGKFVTWVGKLSFGILLKQNSFSFRSFPCQLNRYVVKPADESLMAFANCRQHTQHHSQTSSLLNGS